MKQDISNHVEMLKRTGKMKNAQTLDRLLFLC